MMYLLQWKIFKRATKYEDRAPKKIFQLIRKFKQRQELQALNRRKYDLLRSLRGTQSSREDRLHDLTIVINNELFSHMCFNSQKNIKIVFLLERKVQEREGDRDTKCTAQADIP